MLKIKHIIFWVCICLCLWTTSVMAEKIDLMVENENISTIIICSKSPFPDDMKKYQYQTSKKNEMDFILHLLNSFEIEMIENGFRGSDSRYFEMRILYDDGMEDCIYLIPSTDSAGTIEKDSKTYSILEHSVTEFLDYVYALKKQQINLDDIEIFKISDWASVIIEDAIANDLLPKWNRINYTSGITRLETCQLIANILRTKSTINEEITSGLFLDTKDKDVILLRTLNIVDGKDNNEFYPYALITREELAKVLSATYHYLNDISIIEGNEYSYSDKEDMSEWAIGSINEMTAIGVFKGTENSEFKPKCNATKEEVIVCLVRLQESIQE